MHLEVRRLQALGQLRATVGLLTPVRTCSVANHLTKAREREKQKKKDGDGTGSDQTSFFQIPLCISPPKSTPSLFTFERWPGAFPLVYLLIYHNPPPFPSTTMADLPDIILKNSDQRSLSPKAVAFQVATMAGISVRFLRPSGPTTESSHRCLSWSLSSLSTSSGRTIK